MEYSLFMIKPCAYEKKDEILEIISKKLNVLFTRDINLDEIQEGIRLFILGLGSKVLIIFK
mgnify:CR=1 FL=1